jgi:drug/metabolite transporter (DMT)-like permease
MHILAMPFLVALTIFYRSEIAAMSGEFWLILIAVVICFYPLVDYLYFKTIRSNRLSYILPLLGLISVFTLLIGWLLFGQTQSLMGVLGVLSISLLSVIKTASKRNNLVTLKDESLHNKPNTFHFFLNHI